MISSCLFLSTSSARRTTLRLFERAVVQIIFLSTSSARRTTSYRGFLRRFAYISIHVLREEDDGARRHACDRPLQISIHVLREEDDRRLLALNPVKGNFYPRPPRGGRLHKVDHTAEDLIFLSTSSARRTTAAAIPGLMARKIFLSTSSARRTTFYTSPLHTPIQISIHVLREEDDRIPRHPAASGRYFYPRPPRGGRRYLRDIRDVDTDFYPRPPRGGRLRPDGLGVKLLPISIHVLREEDDSLICTGTLPHTVFLSTSSARRTTTALSVSPDCIAFLSTSSARRTTQPACCRRAACRISIPVPREEDDPRFSAPS